MSTYPSNVDPCGAGTGRRKTTTLSTCGSFLNVRRASSSPWRRIREARATLAEPGIAHDAAFPQRLNWMASLARMICESRSFWASDGWMIWYGTRRRPRFPSWRVLRVARTSTRACPLASRYSRWTFAARSIAPGSPLVSGVKADCGRCCFLRGRRGEPDDERPHRAAEHQRQPEVDEDEAAAVRGVPRTIRAGSARSSGRGEARQLRSRRRL